MPSRVGPTRLVLVLAALVGVLGMHALVVGTPTAAHASASSHGTHAAAATATTTPTTTLAAESTTGTSGASHGSEHGPGDHSGIAHLCLALAAAIFLLAVRRLLLTASPTVPPRPRALLRSAVQRWTRPPPDPVVLCVSRT
jgi:hypothetical protein